MATRSIRSARRRPQPRPRRFYAKISLDPNRPTPQVSNIAQSILSELDRVRGTKLTLTLDIDAETAEGFPEDVESAALTSLDDEKLAEKYRHLAERLSRAFTAGPVAGDERHRYMNALLAIAKFFDGLGPFDTYAEKFITLAAALDDLDNGIVRPVLEPEPVENRIPDPIEVWVGRAYVAIAIEALIKAGNKTDEAKLFIQAREYSPLSALATKKADNLWTAGLGWRYRFRQNRIKNDVAQ